MPDTTLRDLVLKRLDADTKPEDEWSALVLAALEGPDELAKLLERPVRRLSPRAPGLSSGAEGAEESAVRLRAPPPPRIAFLKAITVEGFRGIGPKATLDLTPGPGLTLVVGRNGSGKSSFAEGLELLLTGDTYRWREPQQGLARRLEEPPPPEGRPRRRLRPGGGAGLLHRRVRVAGGPRPRGRRPLGAGQGQAAHPEGRPRLEGRRSRATAPSSPTTSSARSSTRARRSSTTPSPRSSASTPSWTRRPPSSRRAPRATTP